MTTKREEEIRGVLADHADVQVMLRKGLSQLPFTFNSNYGERLHRIGRVMVVCERRQAYEIDLIYSHGNENEAEHCNSCGQWLIAEFCQCVMEQEQLTAQLQQSIERAK